MHRTVVVVVRHAHQIRELGSPDLTAGLGGPTGTAVKHSIDEAPAMHQHQRTRGGHRFEGAGSLRLNPFVNLAAHRGPHVEIPLAAALAQGIGAGRHGLGLKSGQRPLRRHFTADNAGQVGLDAQLVDGQDPAVTHEQSQVSAIAPRAQPDAAGIVAADAQGGRHTAAGQMQSTTTQLHLQPLQPPLLSPQTTHPQGLIRISPQQQLRALRHQHPHLGLLGADRSPRVSRQHHQGHGEGQEHSSDGRGGSVCPAFSDAARPAWQIDH